MDSTNFAADQSIAYFTLQLVAGMSSGSIPTHSEPAESQSSSYKRVWTKPQVEKFLIACKKYSFFTGKPLKNLDAKDFMVISASLPQTTTQCIVKFREIITSGTTKAGAWSKEEDEILKQAVEAGNKKWGLIGKLINSQVHAGVKVRTGKKCKERWLHYLDPQVKKGGWTVEEDLVLLEEFKRHGRKWKIISESLENRIEGSIKNRLKSLLNYVRQEIGIASENELLDKAILKAKTEIGLTISPDN